MYIRLAQFIFQYLVPPDELFGGTWEVFGTGRTLVGISASETEFDTVEKTGGEKTHKLTITEMPSHNHRIGGWITITYGSGWTAIWDYWGGDRQNYSASVGGSQAHNNIQPYITVYMWKRTA